ncbi:carbon-nitrogen family hydrolase [Paucilactobacillus wasatchensis]|uniref:Aliphatic amidase amiE n=1 Tax=Paucilactobacillus wasatchensis TaxID=1335616 RepID=A0A0D0YWI2_9LACO|nr:carbon-nitrogen family hydrolase [Paucilactobacillus wasatchensis]KIS03579.1 Aliphatic amidase amiE [Paucilactobacillus wasatchensis]
MTLKIALAQIDITFATPDDNFARVAKYVEQAAAKQVDVVVFPEMWNTGYALDQLEQIADLNGERTQEFLQQLAVKYHVNIVGGSVAIKRDGHFYNTSYVVNAQGALVSAYDKVHLFGLMNEEKYITAGASEVSFELANVASTGVICYDIRFPEWLRTLSRHGSKVLYVSADWPAVRIPQWEILVRARAIENQSFVVAVNRVGDDPDNHFNGHSLVIDPLGNIVSQAGEQEELVVATIDLDSIEQVRGQIPVFADRRPELYR